MVRSQARSRGDQHHANRFSGEDARGARCDLFTRVYVDGKRGGSSRWNLTRRSSAHRQVIGFSWVVLPVVRKPQTTRPLFDRLGDQSVSFAGTDGSDHEFPSSPPPKKRRPFPSKVHSSPGPFYTSPHTYRLLSLSNTLPLFTDTHILVPLPPESQSSTPPIHKPLKGEQGNIIIQAVAPLSRPARPSINSKLK